MITIGQKHGPAVGFILFGPNALGNGHHSRAIGIDALDRTFGVRRIDDYAFASPTAAASGQCGGKDLRRAAGDCDLLQLAVREKSNVGVIGRPEGVTRALRAGQKRDAGGADALQVEHGHCRVFFRRHEHEQGAVARQRHVADAHLVGHRQRELHARGGLRTPRDEPGCSADGHQRQGRCQPGPERRPTRCSRRSGSNRRTGFGPRERTQCE